MSTEPKLPDTCPACRSTRIAPGKFTDARGGKIFFNLELHINYWKLMWRVPTVLPFDSTASMCLACGLVWTFSNTVEATSQIREFGTPELKARALEPGDALPRAAAAPSQQGADLPLPSVDRKSDAGEG
jgi:hypothetical protein